MRAVSAPWVIPLLVGLVPAFLPLPGQEPVGKPVAPVVKCSDRQSRDQDDMCIWIHPTEPSRSTILAADKAANRIFVYDLEGTTLQSIDARNPGNIDVRHGFPLGTGRVDIVAFNQRDDPKILVYQVDVRSRRLERVDNDAIRTAANYGGTLYRSPKSGKFYFLTTSAQGHVEQFELGDDGAGKVAGRKVRGWKVGGSEAAVADDETGRIYIGEEDRGVWEVGGEPDDPAPGELVIKLGEHGLASDVEGLAIYYLPGGKGYLIVSNQSRNNFKVYQRTGKHEFAGTFAIQGARDSDGLDVCNAHLGTAFPKGLFACHTGDDRCPILLTPWDAIAGSIAPRLTVDTTWERRR
jgi:3-phytase